MLGNAATGPLEDRARSPFSCLLSPRGVKTGAGLLKTGHRPISGCLCSSMELGAKADLLMGGQLPSDEKEKFTK